MVAICGGMWYKVWYKWNRKTFRRPLDTQNEHTGGYVMKKIIATGNAPAAIGP